jgi:hypothetical protein
MFFADSAMKDYKHTQVVERLERDVTGKEVIKGLVPTAFSQLTGTADMASCYAQTDLATGFVGRAGVVQYEQSWAARYGSDNIS